MKRLADRSLEFFVLLYFLSYIPNVLITKLVTSTVHPQLGRPLTGLETLPASLMMNLVLTYCFIGWSGWHRDAHGVQCGRAAPAAADAVYRAVRRRHRARAVHRAAVVHVHRTSAFRSSSC